MAVEAKQRSLQEREQRPLGYLVLNGELLRGPFTYSITDGNESRVNGRRIFPRISSLPSDPTDDAELENIRVMAGQREAEVIVFEGPLHEAGMDMRVRIKRLAEFQTDVVRRNRAVDTLILINSTLESGVSRIIMEGEGSELSFTDRGGILQDRVKEILRADLPDQEKAGQINRLFPTFADLGDAVVANAESWR